MSSMSGRNSNLQHSKTLSLSSSVMTFGMTAAVGNWDCDSDEEEQLLQDVEQFANLQRSELDDSDATLNQPRDEQFSSSRIVAKTVEARPADSKPTSAIEEALRRGQANGQISGSCESLDVSGDDYDAEDSDVDIESQCWKRMHKFRNSTNTLSDPKFIWGGAATVLKDKSLTRITSESAVGRADNQKQSQLSNLKGEAKRPPLKRKPTDDRNRILGEYGASMGEDGNCSAGVSNVDMKRFAQHQKEALVDRSAQMFRDCEGLANQSVNLETRVVRVVNKSDIMRTKGLAKRSNTSLNSAFNNNCSTSMVENSCKAIGPEGVGVGLRYSHEQLENAINMRRNVNHGQVTQDLTGVSKNTECVGESGSAMISPYKTPLSVNLNAFGRAVTPATISSSNSCGSFQQDNLANVGQPMMRGNRYESDVSDDGFEPVLRTDLSAFNTSMEKSVFSQSDQSYHHGNPPFRPPVGQTQRPGRFTTPSSNQHMMNSDQSGLSEESLRSRLSYLTAIRDSMKRQEEQIMSVSPDSGVLMPITSQEREDDDSRSSMSVGVAGDMLGECKCLVGNLPLSPNVVALFKEMLVNFRVDYSCYRYRPQEGRAMVTLCDRIEADRFNRLCNSYVLGGQKLQSVLVSA